jgi:hypothetical protein
MTNGFKRICGPSDDFVIGRLNGKLDETGDETVDRAEGLMDGE